jgi:hypothetical protein
MTTTSQEESRLRSRAAELEQRIADFNENAGSCASETLRAEILEMLMKTLQATLARLQSGGPRLESSA